MSEQHKQILQPLAETEILRRLWDQGVASGEPRKLDFDEFRKRARESLGKAHEEK